MSETLYSEASTMLMELVDKRIYRASTDAPNMIVMGMIKEKAVIGRRYVIMLNIDTVSVHAELVSAGTTPTNQIIDGLLVKIEDDDEWKWVVHTADTMGLISKERLSKVLKAYNLEKYHLMLQAQRKIKIGNEETMVVDTRTPFPDSVIIKDE